MGALKVWTTFSSEEEQRKKRRWKFWYSEQWGKENENLHHWKPLITGISKMYTLLGFRNFMWPRYFCFARYPICFAKWKVLNYKFKLCTGGKFSLLVREKLLWKKRLPSCSFRPFCKYFFQKIKTFLGLSGISLRKVPKMALTLPKFETVTKLSSCKMYKFCGQGELS